MLVLNRKVGERIVIGDNIVVTLNRIAGSRATVGIEAPNHVRVIRAELEEDDDTELYDQHIADGNYDMEEGEAA